MSSPDRAHQSSAAQRLFHLASRFAEYTGWMFQESGDIATARRWTAYAGDLAVSGDQPDVVQFCRIRAADLALDEYRLAEAIDLAGQVQLVPGVSSHIHAMAALVQARGHALAGEASACDAALANWRWRTTARSLSRSRWASPAWPIRWRPHAAWPGTNWESRRARTVLHTALRGARPTSVRSRVRLAVRTALADADAGDLHAARDLVQEMLDDVQAVDSAPIRADLRQLMKTFNRSRTAEFSDVRQQMKTAVSSSRPA